MTNEERVCEEFVQTVRKVTGLYTLAEIGAGYLLFVRLICARSVSPSEARLDIIRSLEEFKDS